MKNIYFMTDFLFHDFSNESTYHNWFFSLLKPIINSIGIISCYEFKDIINKNNDTFSRNTFFKISNIENPEFSYYLYDINKISESSWNYFFNFIDEDDFILGFELGKELREKLNYRNIKFINFWIHSFKLFYDITFMCNTNDLYIYNTLIKYQIHNHEFEFFGNFWKTYIKEKKLIYDNNIENNSILFIGQMPNDKSVQNGLKYLNITDYEDKLDALSLKYSKIYYQEHPSLSLLKNNITIDKINLFIKNKHYIEKLPKNTKTYSLLSSEKIAKVISISSSVIFEARYFGKDTEYLYRPLFIIDGEFGINTFISINASLWSQKFWADIFQVKGTFSEHSYLNYHKDYIRDIKNIYFGYDFLDREFSSKNNCSLLNIRMQKVETSIQNIFMEISKYKYKKNILKFKKGYVTTNS